MIAGIVLAAGESKRMGRPKQLIEIGGKTLLQHVVDIALASRLDQILVVVGHQASEVGASLNGREVRIVANPNYRAGLSTSVRQGLAALPPEADGAMFLLGDQPGITVSLLNRLLASSGPNDIVAPSFAGRRGNPTVFGHRWFGDLMRTRGDAGGRHIIEAHPEAVTLVEASAELRDLDTPADVEDYAALRSSSKRA